MPASNIVTGQFVRISQTPASVGERMGAQLIDWILQFAYAYTMVWLLDAATHGINASTTWLYILLLVLPVVFYSLLCELLAHGQTVGKRVLKLRVVKADGSQPSLGALLMRWVLFVVDGPTLGFIGVLAILLSRNNQRLGDMAAGTMVIRLGSYSRIAVSLDEFSHLAPDYRPHYPQAEELSLEQATLISQTAALDFDDPRVGALAKKVQQTLGIQTVREPLARDFLRRIERDFQYYALQDV